MTIQTPTNPKEHLNQIIEDLNVIIKEASSDIPMSRDILQIDMILLNQNKQKQVEVKDIITYLESKQCLSVLVDGDSSIEYETDGRTVSVSYGIFDIYLETQKNIKLGIMMSLNSILIDGVTKLPKGAQNNTVMFFLDRNRSKLPGLNSFKTLLLADVAIMCEPGVVSKPKDIFGYIL